MSVLTKDPMRWFASLVVLCLVAGSGVRPRAEVREPHATQQLAAAEGVVPLVSARRGHSLPELGHRGQALFVITPVAPAIVAPAQVALPAARAQVAQYVRQSLRVHAARGPPSGELTLPSSFDLRS